MQTFPKDLSAYDLWQLANKGDILKKDSNAFNNTRPKPEQDEDKVNQHFEIQLILSEYDRSTS